MFLTLLLPYPSFRQSVACYSDPTLVATLAFMDEKCRTFRTRDIDLSWEQREMLRFWKGREQGFIRFGLMCVEEAKQREVAYSQDMAAALNRFKEGKHWQKPLWVGWKRFHSDHRAILLQLGEVECIHARVLKHLCDEGEIYTSPHDWLAMRGYSGLAQGDTSYNTDIQQYLDDEGIPPLADNECLNHYAQFNWGEEPDGQQRTWPPEDGMWFATRTRGRPMRSLPSFITD